MRRFSRAIGNLLLLASGTGLLLLLLVVMTGSGQWALLPSLESPALAQVPSSGVTAPGPPFGPVANASAGTAAELVASRPTQQASGVLSTATVLEGTGGRSTPTANEGTGILSTPRVNERSGVQVQSITDTSPSIAAPSAPTPSAALPEPPVPLSAVGVAPTPTAPVEAQVDPPDSSDPLLPAQPDLGYTSAAVLDPVPITGVTLPRIGLVADVVPAPLAELDDGATWLVPAFKAGHAQYTAGAGQSGNAVVLGHVTSRSLGNVFERLYLGRVGDVVLVFSGPEQVFEYRVVEVQAVSRTDVSVLQPTDTPSISLITCTGVWNAALHDYMERLVVRAELTS